MDQILTAVLRTAILLILSTSWAYAAGSGSDFLKAGEKALNEKQYELAIKHLSKAMGDDGLSQGETAKAFYLRGVAFNKKGEPARSIADLTRAIFFKKLSPETKSKILMARAEAYKAVGLTSRAEKDLRAAGVGSTQIATVRQPAQPIQQQKTQKKAPPQITRIKPIPTNRPVLQKKSTSDSAAVTTGWGASVQAKQAQQQPQRKTRRNGDGSFKKMFESQTQEAPRSSSDNRVASTTQWNSGDRNNARAVSHTNGSTGVRSEVPRIQAGSGRYRLQLAAVSSENDAQQAWARLVAQHSTLLAGQRPDFQQVNLGNQKSVVRIQIGPFPDKAQTLNLCNTFKEQGLDCFLVVR